MNKLKYIILALATLGAVSCLQEKDFEALSSVPLKRCLEPMNLSARVDANSGVKTTFKWDVTSEAEAYILEVTTEEGARVLYDTLAPAQVPFVTNLEADGKYTFKVQGISSKLDDSNWAEYDNTFKTYAIKDNLFLTVTAKTSESVSLSWSSDPEDYKDVTHIEAAPITEGKKVKLDIENDEAAKTAAAATIGGLVSSTEYEIILYFKSASRGVVTVWTSPAPGTLTKVTTADALKAAMTAGDDVYVGAEGSPYAVGSVTPAKGFRMLGEYGADGSQPVGRTAKSVMFDADEKIWVEGHIAFSKGRYIGANGGSYVIWKEGAERYWGESN